MGMTTESSVTRKILKLEFLINIFTIKFRTISNRTSRHSFPKFQVLFKFC